MACTRHNVDTPLPLTLHVQPVRQWSDRAMWPGWPDVCSNSPQWHGILESKRSKNIVSAHRRLHMHKIMYVAYRHECRSCHAIYFKPDWPQRSISLGPQPFPHFVSITSVEFTTYLLLEYKECSIVHETVVPYRCKVVFHNTPLNTS